MTKYEFRFHKMQLEHSMSLQLQIDKDNAEEDTAKSEYIATLEDAVTKLQAELEAQILRYQKDIKPRQDVVGYMSHVGRVLEDNEYEDIDDTDSKEPESEPEAKCRTKIGF